MKRNFKRMFALVMTLALAISCATGAFAAEPDETTLFEDTITVSGDDIIAVSFNDGKVSVNSVDSNSDVEIVPYGDYTFVNESGSLSDKETKSGSFVFPENGTLYYALSTYGSVNFKLSVQSWIISKDLFNRTVTNETVSGYAPNMQKGVTINWSITSNGYTGAYAIQIKGTA